LSATQILIACLLVAGLFAMAGMVRAAGVRLGWSAEVQRKLVHVGVGLQAILLPLFIQRAGFLVFAGLALAALLLLRSPWGRQGAGAAVHAVERRSHGDLLFLLSVTVLFLRAPGDAALYVLPIAVLTLSDAAAAVIGTAYGRRLFGSGDRVKSVEGVVAFFVITWMVSVTILITATDLPRLNTVLLATLVAAFAAQVEAESWHGLDNLFVPLGIHALLTFNGAGEPWPLALLAAAFVGSMFAAQWAAPHLGMTAHALRSNALCLFLTAGMTSPRHAVLPIAAFLAHIAARRDTLKPEQDDLDFVVLVCAVGVFWLAAAAIAGRLGTEFYCITFAGVFAGLSVLALRLRWRWRGVMGGLAVGIMAFLLYRWSVTGDAAAVVWTGRTQAGATAALTIAACVAAALWRPTAPWRRGLWFACVALAVPAVAFTSAVLGR
jgi:phytol kinase